MFDIFKFSHTWKSKPQDKDSNTYQATLFCENCDERFTVNIVKGTGIDGFCENLPCPNCGCKTVRKSALHDGQTYY